MLTAGIVAAQSAVGRMLSAPRSSTGVAYELAEDGPRMPVTCHAITTSSTPQKSPGTAEASPWNRRTVAIVPPTIGVMLYENAVLGAPRAPLRMRVSVTPSALAYACREPLTWHW